MSEIFNYGHNVTGSAADLFIADRAVCSFNVGFPFDLQRSLRLLSKRGFIVKTTPLSRSLYYHNKQSDLTAFVTSNGETMFFNNQLAKIFVCSSHVWAIFYRPNGERLR